MAISEALLNEETQTPEEQRNTEETDIQWQQLVPFVGQAVDLLVTLQKSDISHLKKVFAFPTVM